MEKPKQMAFAFVDQVRTIDGVFPVLVPAALKGTPVHYLRQLVGSMAGALGSGGFAKGEEVVIVSREWFDSLFTEVAAKTDP